MFRLYLPRSDNHPQVMLIVNFPTHQVQMTFDDSHFHHDIELPAGVTEDDVEVLAQFIKRDGNVDPGYKTMIVKERVVKSDPEPQRESDQLPERLDQSTGRELPINVPTEECVDQLADEPVTTRLAVAEESAAANVGVSETSEPESSEAGSVPVVHDVKEPVAPPVTTPHKNSRNHGSK